MLAAWVWLAWFWMSKIRINGRDFLPDALTSLAAMRAAGAPEDFLRDLRTAAALADKGYFDLAREILRAFWGEFPPNALIVAALAFGEALADQIPEALPVPRELVEKGKEAVGGFLEIAPVVS